jgi:hypothetical protein
MHRRRDPNFLPPDLRQSIEREARELHSRPGNTLSIQTCYALVIAKMEQDLYNQMKADVEAALGRKVER